MKPRPAIRMRSLAAAAAMLLAATSADGRITKSRSTASSGIGPPLAADALWEPLYYTVIGGGIEYLSDAEETEIGFPLLFEYNITEMLKLTIEPVFVTLDPKDEPGGDITGWGDTETSLDFEFIRERRYRPAFSLEGKIRWPTATHEDLGEPGHDCSLGLIVSKEFVHFDLDLNALYTFSGDPEQKDGIELSLALGWHLTHRLDLIAEIATGAAASRSRLDDSSAANFESEAVVGLSWRATDHLTLEQGIIFKDDGEWEAIVAWEWSFGGED